VVASIVGAGFIGPGPQATAASGAVEPVRSLSVAASTPSPSGIETVWGQSTVTSSDTKTAIVLCPQGKKAISGGGLIHGAYEPGVAVLTDLLPLNNGLGYEAVAAESKPGTTKAWSLTVEATCANPMPGYQIVTGRSEQPPSSALQTAIARCPSTKRVVGTGAAIQLDPYDTPIGDKGLALQLVRSSGPGDITRAQAREAPGGYPNDWHLTAYAICANTPPGYEVVYSDPSPDGGQTWKFASLQCPKYWTTINGYTPALVQKRMLGNGAAVDPLQPGSIALVEVDAGPLTDFYRADARAIDTSFSSRPWGTISAQAICAY